MGGWLVVATVLGPAQRVTAVEPFEPVEREEPGWADPVRRWPDPVADTGLGSEETYYWFSRNDQRSLLPVASVERPLRVYVGGDSLSGGPAFGFEELVTVDPTVQFVGEVRLSTGVVTEWYFDWRAHLRDVVANDGYDVVVLSMGGNDAQRFRGHSSEHVGSEAWRARYAGRVASMMEALDRPGRLVIWVGMPAVALEQLTGLPEIVNPLAVAAADGGRRFAFLDASAVVAPNGVFTRFIEGPDGVPLNVREGDGVHYTRAGGELLVDEIMALVAEHSG